MSAKSTKRKRVARIGKGSGDRIQEDSLPLDNDCVHDIMKSMDSLHTSEQSIKSYQQKLNSASIPQHSNPEQPYVRKQKIFARKSHPLMDKCQREKKYIHKNRSIPKPRAHVGYIPRPSKNPSLNSVSNSNFQRSIETHEKRPIPVVKNKKRLKENCNKKSFSEENLPNYDSPSDENDEYEKFIKQHNVPQSSSDSEIGYKAKIRNKKNKRRKKNKIQSERPKKVSKLDHLSKRVAITSHSEDSLSVSNFNAESVESAAGSLNREDDEENNLSDDSLIIDEPLENDNYATSDSLDSEDENSFISNSSIKSRIKNSNNEFEKCDSEKNVSEEILRSRLSTNKNFQIDDPLPDTSKINCESRNTEFLQSNVQIQMFESVISNDDNLINNRTEHDPAPCVAVHESENADTNSEEIFNPKILSVQSISANDFSEVVIISDDDCNKSHVTKPGTKILINDDSDIEILDERSQTNEVMYNLAPRLEDSSNVNREGISKESSETVIEENDCVILSDHSSSKLNLLKESHFIKDNISVKNEKFDSALSETTKVDNQDFKCTVDQSSNVQMTANIPCKSEVDDRNAKILDILRTIDPDCIKRVIEKTAGESVLNADNFATPASVGNETNEQSSTHTMTKDTKPKSELVSSRKDVDVITIGDECPRNEKSETGHDKRGIVSSQSSVNNYVVEKHHKTPSESVPIPNTKNKSAFRENKKSLSLETSQSTSKSKIASLLNTPDDRSVRTLHTTKTLNLVNPPNASIAIDVENPLDELDRISSDLIQELDGPNKNSVIPLLQLYSAEYEKYLEIQNTERNVSAGLKLLEEEQEQKLLHLRSSIKNLVTHDPCFQKIAESTLPQLTSDSTIHTANASFLEKQVSNNPCCAECGKKATSKCQACGSTYYCSKECGEMFWTKRHHAECTSMKNATM